ncbi:MAG: YceI family protein [Kiritimatiellae bacterium]|nr:YceI family protein [Kiritimatiellia bacterium]
MNPRRMRVGVLGLVVATAVAAGPRVYDFRDPKGVNGLHILLDTAVEPIVGLAGGVSGEIEFDPGAPEKTAGYIEVETRSVRFVNPTMTRVAMGADWFDADRHPALRFEIRKIASAVSEGENRWRLRAEGMFRCRGVERPLTIEIVATHLPGRLGERMEGATGDLLVLRTAFSVRRTEFGMTKDPEFRQVADEVQIRGAIVGQSPR